MIDIEQVFLSYRKCPDLMTYFKSLDDPIVQESIRKSFSPAACLENLFSAAELNELCQFAFTKSSLTRHSSNGTIFLTGDMEPCFDLIRDKVSRQFPELLASPTVGGNFFITPTQYGVHNDSPKLLDFQKTLSQVAKDDSRRRYYPYKNIIIPLWVKPAVKSQIIFFEQRFVGWAHVFNHNYASGNTVTSYPVIEDMTKVSFYNSKGQLIHKMNPEFPEKDFEEYFVCKKTRQSLTPRQRLTNLSLERVFDWVPGSALVFDSTQLHATNRGENLGMKWNLKMGLLLTFAQPLPSD